MSPQPCAEGIHEGGDSPNDQDKFAVQWSRLSQSSDFDAAIEFYVD